MCRRLYFLIPDLKHAERLVKQLVENGVSKVYIHSISRQGVDLSKLPKSHHLQRDDAANRVKDWLWNTNLVIFYIALAIALTLILYQSPFWALIPMAIMLTGFLVGFKFASQVPNAQINELRSAIHHGEILLLADVPKQRVREIVTLISHTHPEVAAGGSGIGWSLPALQL